MVTEEDLRELAKQDDHELYFSDEVQQGANPRFANLKVLDGRCTCVEKVNPDFCAGLNVWSGRCNYKALPDSPVCEGCERRGHDATPTQLPGDANAPAPGAARPDRRGEGTPVFL